MGDPEFGLEDWQKQFVRQWHRDVERSDGNMPDPRDFELYYDGSDEDEDVR
jgi:hypothetical protein